MKRSLMSLLLASLFATANAATFIVTNTSDSGPGSLRDAIAQANAATGADTVMFDVTVSGAILLTSGPIKISDAVTIVGPGANILTIDGNANGRIFNVSVTAPACPALDGPDYLVSISGLRLTNARFTTGNAGGAFYSEHSLALDSMIIDHNVAGQGGGGWYKHQYPGQTLTITNSQFLCNTAKPLIATPGFPHSGGALGIEDKCATPIVPAPVIIANSVFAGNRSQPVRLNGFGGALAMFSLNMDATISDSRIVDNHIDVPNPAVAGNLYRGGGFYGRPKSLTIVRSEISDNSTNATSTGVTQGGAIAFVNFTPALQTPTSTTALNIVNSTISGNTDGAFGGGLWVYGNVAVNIDNSTVSNNAAPATHGGGILLATGPTLPASANNALTPTLTLVSSIVADNVGDDLASRGISSLAVNANTSLTGTVCSTCAITVVGSGNLSGVDPMLDELEFNGGPTRTQALLLGSPAIGMGSNPLGLDTDQRGPGFPREVNGATDIGAYQTQPSELLSALMADVTDLHFKQALGLLTNVSRQLEAGNLPPACNGLNAFVHQVEAQAGKQLTVSEANDLVAGAQQIRAVLDCE